MKPYEEKKEARERNYAVAAPDELINLCVENGWFTRGTSRQYQKLFRMNEEGCPLGEIAAAIWLCTDDGYERRDILEDLKEAKEKSDGQKA